MRAAAKSTATTAEPTSGNDSGSNDVQDMSDAMDALGGDCMQAGLAYFALSMQALGASFGATESDLQEMQDSVDELKAEIPSEIKDDFQVYADALAEYANNMKEIDMNDLLDPSTQQKAEEAAAVLDTPEVTKAQENIEKYFDETCPSSDSSSSSS